MPRMLSSSFSSASPHFFLEAVAGASSALAVAASSSSCVRRGGGKGEHACARTHNGGRKIGNNYSVDTLPTTPGPTRLVLLRQVVLA